MTFFQNHRPSIASNEVVRTSSFHRQLLSSGTTSTRNGRPSNLTDALLLSLPPDTQTLCLRSVRLRDNPKDDNVAADWHIVFREAVQQQPAFPLEAGRVRKILERFGWSIEELPSAVSSRIAASLIHALLHVDRSLYELQHQQSLASSAT
eukprot:Platyproteum_vivax@DN7691_c3_g2_i2.p1